MNISRFDTVGYFIKHYFNWSMNDSDLENLIEDFLERENKETIKEFRSEIEILYLLNNTDIITEVFSKLGNRGVKTKEAKGTVKMLYEKSKKK